MSTEAPSQHPAGAAESSGHPGAGGELAGKAYLRLVWLGALVGVPAALLAAGFLALVRELEHWLWSTLPKDLGASTPPWYLVIGLPIVGAGVVVIARKFLPGDGGHNPLKGIGGGAIPISHGPGIALAALGTLAFGAVLGPEAPLIALGSVAGVTVATFARLASKETAVISEAGSFSAISALFGGPIVGGMLMIEGGVGMGTMLIPVLIPGFVAAALGYVLFVGLGDWGGLSSQSLAVPDLPIYHATSIPDLLVALGVGVVAALLITVVRACASRVAKDGLRSLGGMPGLLFAGALAVGLLAQGASWLGADSQEVLFSGQTSLPALVAAGSTGIVFVLLIAKALAYAVSLGCGFRGGPVFPAIFLGTALATLTVDLFGVSPTLAVAVGTAAGMTAMTRLLLTPMVLAALLVGHNGLGTVPAAVLAAVAAWLTMTMLDRRSQQAEAASAS
jgi:H+/Cl- antiporter ClcA